MTSKSISLSRKELSAFLTLIGVSRMNGLDNAGLYGLREGYAAEWFISGKQLLVDRGLLVIDGFNNAVFDDALVALVGGSALPKAALLMSMIPPGRHHESHYLNATSDLLIEHSVIDEDTYKFDYLAGSEALILRVQSILAPLHSIPQPSDGIVQILSSRIMTDCIEQCRQGNGINSQQLLIEAGWSHQAAVFLSHDCARHPMWLGVVGWGLREPQPIGGDVLLAIQGDQRCWLIENEPGPPDLVRIRQVSGPECEKAFLTLLEPLIRIYQLYN